MRLKIFTAGSVSGRHPRHARHVRLQHGAAAAGGEGVGPGPVRQVIRLSVQALPQVLAVALRGSVPRALVQQPHPRPARSPGARGH